MSEGNGETVLYLPSNTPKGPLFLSLGVTSACSFSFSFFFTSSAPSQTSRWQSGEDASWGDASSEGTSTPLGPRNHGCRAGHSGSPSITQTREGGCVKLPLHPAPSQAFSRLILGARALARRKTPPAAAPPPRCQSGDLGGESRPRTSPSAPAPGAPLPWGPSL